MCSGDCDEACELIFDWLLVAPCSDDETAEEFDDELLLSKASDGP